MKPQKFHLVPFNPNDPDWSASIYVGPIFVGAYKEGEAREIAANATQKKIEDRQASPSLRSPWLDHRKSACVVSYERELTHKEVITEDGRNLPL